MQRHLQKLNTLQIQKLVPSEIDTAILPVGTVEAHGASCLGTDNLIPENIAAGIAERINALIVPTVNYGITRSVYRYPGGFSIKPSTFQLYVRDVLDSLADSKFKNIFVLNGHGGNNSDLKSVAYEFHREKKANIAVLHWWHLCADMTTEFFGHVGGHGGTDETAMVLAVDPELADKEAHDDDLAWYFRPGADVYPVPGSVLLYKEGEGYPNFDVKQASEYREKVVDCVGEFAETVLNRWRKLGL
ncbi:MAG: creatininase family protein [Candidatus Zixiibacteriota bacterium]|nr:MAG: creatininase family protein [candidate division Zixibacteria bacterium]